MPAFANTFFASHAEARRAPRGVGLSLFLSLFWAGPRGGVRRRSNMRGVNVFRVTAVRSEIGHYGTHCRAASTDSSTHRRWLELSTTEGVRRTWGGSGPGAAGESDRRNHIG